MAELTCGGGGFFAPPSNIGYTQTPSKIGLRGVARFINSWVIFPGSLICFLLVLLFYSWEILNKLVYINPNNQVQIVLKKWQNICLNRGYLNPDYESYGLLIT